MKKSKGKYPTVCFFRNWLESSYHYRLTTAIRDAARARNVNLIIFPGGALHSTVPQEITRNSIYDMANTDVIDGIIVMSAELGIHSTHDQMEEFVKRYKGIPCVSISTPLNNAHSIVMDNGSGVGKLLNHLIKDHDLKRIAIIKGAENAFDAIDRYDSYRRVLTENGIPIDPNLVAPGNFDQEGGREAVRLLLDTRKVRFDAIFASNDSMAQGAIYELKARGIKVPGDIAVVGFDDLDFCKTTNPPITTVVQPLNALCLKAMEILLMLIGDENAPKKTVIDTELVIRRSCGCRPVRILQGAGNGQKAELGPLLDDLFDEIRLVFIHYGFIHEGDSIIRELGGCFLDAVMNKAPESLFAFAEDQIYEFILKHGVPVLWQDVASVLQKYAMTRIPDGEKSAAALAYLNDVRSILFDLERKFNLDFTIRDRGQLTLYRAMATYSLSCNDVDSLLHFLAEEIRRFDIQSLTCSLFELEEKETDSLPLKSRLIFVYDKLRFPESLRESTLFPTRSLLPEGILPENRRYTLILEPLMFKNRLFGIAFFEFIENNNMYAFFVLRMVILNALNALLFVRQMEESYQSLQVKNIQIEKLSFAVEHSASIITITDTKGIIEYVNPKFLEFNGYAKDEVVGKKTSILKTGHTPSAKYDHMWRTIASGNEWRGELFNRKKGGERYWALTVISPIRDQRGTVTNFVSIQEDITEFKVKEEMLLTQKKDLTVLANIDSLTGLYNRRHFYELGEQALIQAVLKQTSLSVMMIDIDHFKEVNDRYGHTKGDLILKIIAQNCSKSLREHDLLGRYGGEEFAVLLPDLELKPAMIVGERMRLRIEKETFDFDGYSIKVTVSIGIAQLSGIQMALNELLDQADFAMYKAKNLGRNRVESFKDDDLPEKN